MRQNRIRLLIFSGALLLVACYSAGESKSDVPLSQPLPETPGLQRIGDIPPGDYPQKLHCADTHHCWLQQGRRLLRTSNGGQNWTLVNMISEEEPLRDFKFYDQQQGWAIAFSELYKTEDGGKTWDSVPAIIRPTRDRPWLGIDRSKGPRAGKIYVTFSSGFSSLTEELPAFAFSIALMVSFAIVRCLRGNAGVTDLAC